MAKYQRYKGELERVKKWDRVKGVYGAFFFILL
jgi:hypothetical protein